MNTTTALIAFCAWYLLLTFVVVFFRAYKANSERLPINAFDPDGRDLPGFGNRLTRARNNCFENLPLFVALVFVASQTNNLGATDGTAAFVVYARLAQSTVHLISTSVPAVMLRATLLSAQYGIFIYWIYLFLR